MNIVGHPKKKELWRRLKDRQPDIAVMITNVVRIFEIEPKVIDVRKREPEPPEFNLWEQWVKK